MLVSDMGLSHVVKVLRLAYLHCLVCDNHVLEVRKCEAS